MHWISAASFVVVLASAAGCGGASRTTDSGADAAEDGGADAGERDASLDGGDDAGGGGSDAGLDAGGDAGDAGTDAGGEDAGGDDAGRDAGLDAGSDASGDASIPPGECHPDSSLCTPTCFRPISCVSECGGPETDCGCCPCAPGHIDTIECSSSE